MSDKSKVETRKSKDKDLKAQITQLTEDLKRSHADFINFRRRSESEQAQIMALAKKETVSKLLPVIDNLERALEHLPVGKPKDQVSLGFEMIANQLQSTLREDFGIREIKAEGADFDPRLHEAVEFKDGQGEKEVVTAVLKKGYRMGDTILRPAVVRVGKISSKSKKR